jgi:hypothetical protein
LFIRLDSMLRQIENIKIDSEIIPNKGIGDIHLGMNCFYLRKVFSENFKGRDDSIGEVNDKGNWSYELGKPFLDNLTLTYKEFISITINLFTGSISMISVRNNFKGKLLNTVGIGGAPRKFYENAQELGCEFCEFIEGQFFFWMEEKRYGLALYVADDFTECGSDEEFEKLLDYPIKEIQIFDNEQSIPQGIEEFPSEWK